MLCAVRTERIATQGSHVSPLFGREDDATLHHMSTAEELPMGRIAASGSRAGIGAGRERNKEEGEAQAYAFSEVIAIEAPSLLIRDSFPIFGAYSDGVSFSSRPMSLVTWNPSFSVDVAEIDAQHQHLVAMLNQLNEAMGEARGDAELGKILTGLEQYADEHFLTEEKYFVLFHYEHTAEHKAQHDDFRRKVAAFRADFQAKKALVTIQVLHFLRDWVTNHILGSDHEYVRCFHEHGLS